MGESKQEHLIVGVSPFNPRFTPEWLSSAFQWGAERFSTVDVLHPGENFHVAAYVDRYATREGKEKGASAM